MSDLPVAPGEILAGKYRVEKLLGEGGHGVVVSARHIALGERVAIKLLRPEIAKLEEAIARFLREARASARIKGEHVARVLDVGETESGMPYMVMEHLDGSDLSTLVEKGGPLPIPKAIDYILQTCEALAEAHALGIVHRDIKPSNLFLTTRPNGTPCIKVLDFGISKASLTLDGEAPAHDLTQTQTVLGSPQYMAPEQMRSSKRVDSRTDIWALGTTLYELIVGQAPFEATTLPELFAMILQDTAPRLGEKRTDVPPELEVVVARCLEKNPEHRFRDVRELAYALAPMASAEAGVVDRINHIAPAPDGPRSSAPPRPSMSMESRSAPALSRTQLTTASTRKRGRYIPLLALATATVAIVGTAGMMVGAQKRPPPASSTDLAASASSPVATAAVSAPPPASVATTTSSSSPLASAVDEPVHAASAAPAPKPAATAGKKHDPRSRAGTEATTAAPPPPSPTAPAEPPRPSGVASSRYD